jgi:hypothetical protein
VGDQVSLFHELTRAVTEKLMRITAADTTVPLPSPPLLAALSALDSALDAVLAAAAAGEAAANALEDANAAAADAAATAQAIEAAACIPLPSDAELAAIQREMVCYVTLSDAEEDTLGFGLDLPEKPNGPANCPCEIISAGAFYESGVRKSSYKSPLNAFLPLFLTPAHFARVSAALFDKVAPRDKLVGKLFSVLNGMVVAVSNGDSHASIVQMRGFSQLHRLLLALLAADPAAAAACEARVARFIDRPEVPGWRAYLPLFALTLQFHTFRARPPPPPSREFNAASPVQYRTKNHEPNLGELLIAKLLCPQVRT